MGDTQHRDEGTAVSVSEAWPLDAGGQLSSAEHGFRSSLSILLPVHNEADTVEQTLLSIRDQIGIPLNAELVVCEDGSTDGTDAILRRLAEKGVIRLLTDAWRKGYAGAVRDGLRHIRSDFVFFTDSDGQYDPADFWRLWPAAQACDIVIGRKVKRQEPLHRILLSRGFHVLVKALFNIPLRDIDCGFRILRREMLDDVLPEVHSLPFSFWAEFTIVAYQKGYQIMEVPVAHRPRLRGLTNIYRFERLPSIIIAQLIGIIRLRRRLSEPLPR